MSKTIQPLFGFYPPPENGWYWIFRKYKTSFVYGPKIFRIVLKMIQKKLGKGIICSLVERDVGGKSLFIVFYFDFICQYFTLNA
jgi:hypothetical protein